MFWKILKISCCCNLNGTYWRFSQTWSVVCSDGPGELCHSELCLHPVHSWRRVRSFFTANVPLLVNKQSYTFVCAGVMGCKSFVRPALHFSNVNLWVLLMFYARLLLVFSSGWKNVSKIMEINVSVYSDYRSASHTLFYMKSHSVKTWLLCRNQTFWCISNVS